MTDAVPQIEALLNGSDSERFVALAAMPLAQYDRLRKDVARGMGIRVETLDLEVQRRRPAHPTSSGLTSSDAPPWPDEVDGAELLDSLAAEYGRFIVMPPASCDAAALWTLMTYAVQALFILPLLLVTSPQKRCGKSNLLMLLSSTCRRPLLASNATPAALFRIIEAYKPTLLLDETDAWAKESEELRGIFNAGHSRKTAYVLRIDGDKLEPKVFDCYCPKALAGIGALADTVQDRAIVIELKRRAPGEKVQPLRQDRLDLTHLRSMCMRWAADHVERIRDADAEVPRTLNDRAADNWRGLLAIADLAGGAWPERARRAALTLSAGERDEDDLTMMLLADIREILAAGSGRMSSQELCDALALLTERPWSDWRRGKPISPAQLARKLRPFGVTTRNFRIGQSVGKRYEVSDFADTFARYLKSGDQPATPLQPLNSPTKGDVRAATRDLDVAATPLHAGSQCSDEAATGSADVAARIRDFPLKNKGCSGVAGKCDGNEVLEI